jgi:hypothetical protein
MLSKSTAQRMLTVFSVMLLAGAVIYLLKRSILDRSEDIDFRFIWTAGKLWVMGIDPYSPRFTTLGREMFPTGNEVAYWLYPPQWWIIARPLAAFPVERALVIWRGINAMLLIAASLALALAVRRVRPETPPWAFALLIAIVALMEGTAQTLLLGQTSIIVFAGFCLRGMALLTSRQMPMAAALVLLLLKPQFALPIMVCLAITKKWRMSGVVAVMVTGVACLPQVMQYGLLPTLGGMLGNMALHGQLTSNLPENLIGFSHLVWLVTGANLSNAWDLALDLAATLIFGVLVYRRQSLDDRDQAALAVGLIASAMFFLPLHTYDTVALGPIAFLAILLERSPRYLAWAAVAFALRAGVIGGLFADRAPADRALLSLAGLLALIAAATAAKSRFRAQDGVQSPA